MSRENLMVPDFDSYPTMHRVLSATTGPRQVRVTWDDGMTSRYHVFWLRENAPDPTTTHPVTREQALPLVDIPDDLEAVWVDVTKAGGLAVGWSTGETSRYDPGWLRAYDMSSADLFSLPERVLWDGDLPADATPRFHGPSVLASEDLFEAWTLALHTKGFAILEGLPLDPSVIETVPARLGPIRTTNFGAVFDVRSRPDADSNAYTAMTLPVHSDLTTREYMPGLQFLHCIENSALGGDSLLADGFQVARRLEALHPTHFETLRTVPVTAYNKARDTDYRWTAPMIKVGADGDLEEVRWSPWLRAPVKASFEETDRLYAALKTVFALANDPVNRIKVRLRPGDLLGFDNRRVLHGRTGFDPSTGDRWLRGCYVEREELMSRLRIAARARRAGEVAAVMVS